MIRLLPCVLAVLLFSHVSASAHPFHGESGLASGFLHPFTGVDHLLAMFAVGLWAWQLGGRARWAVPAAFVLIMLAGFGLGIFSGFEFPLVEPAILSSVFVLGLLVLLAVRLPLEAACGLVALFALFHGYAHGAEMPENASLLLYAAGFALGTALLHAGGIGLGIISARFSHPAIVRAAGALVILAGIFVLVS